MPKPARGSHLIDKRESAAHCRDMLVLAWLAAQSSLDIDQVEPLEAALRRHVAYVRSEIPEAEDSPLSPMLVDGFAIVTGRKELRCQAFLVKGARSVRVQGPDGRMAAEVVHVDVERRVAHLRSARPLASIGLVPAEPSPPEERKVEMDLMALVATAPGSGVVFGLLLDLGDAPELEGNLRSTLMLEKGMPVFDRQRRWLGFARAVAWDKDRSMLVPPELTRTATVQRAPSAPARPSNDRPWWAR